MERIQTDRVNFRSNIFIKGQNYGSRRNIRVHFAKSTEVDTRKKQYKLESNFVNKLYPYPLFKLKKLKLKLIEKTRRTMYKYLI